jgi:carboxylesterase
MKLKRIPPGTTTLVSSLPRALDGGRVGALLLHGFTGTPRDLEALGARLHEAGLSVRIPRLPGHGTNGRDFLQTGWRDWLRSAADAYMDLRAQCDQVHVVGFSMGGLLAVLLAARFPVERLVLMAPALQARNPFLPLTPLLSLFLRRVPAAVTATQEILDPDYEVQAREYWRWRFVPQAASLFRLQRMGRRALPLVKADTLTVVGDQDQSVPLSVIALVKKRAAAARTEHIVVPKGTHLVLAGAEGDKAMTSVARWLTGSVGAARARRRSAAFPR